MACRTVMTQSLRRSMSCQSRSSSTSALASSLASVHLPSPLPMRPTWAIASLGNNAIYRLQVRSLSVKVKESEVIYEGPMGKLISSLKVFSITSAFLSTFGLPAFMVSKGLDSFTTVHYAMCVSSALGSIGSTVGLHFIFAPYVHKLERINVKHSSYRQELAKGIVGDAVDSSSTQQEETQQFTETPTESTSDLAEPDYLLKATTRSIFVTKVETMFNPFTDVERTPPGTMRPFCSFLVKGKPLYIHEQLIGDPTLNKSLFRDKPSVLTQTKNPDPDDSFL